MKVKGTAICLMMLLTSWFISIHTSAFGSSLKVRVLISSGQPQVSVGTLDKIKVFQGRAGRLVGLLSKEDPIVCRPAPLGLEVGEYHIQGDSVLLSSPDEAPIQVGQRWYRGEIIIHRDTGYRLEVINELDLELYLQGIMKQEISPQWPEACLKAQAIVARSYALYERQRNADSSFDLKSTVESQAYLGLDGEDPLTNKAVMSTRYMILVNNGQPLPAFYHACCGGHTEAAEDIFGSYPALPGVPCRFCRDAPYYTWEVSFSDFEIRNFLLRSGMKVGPVRSFQPSGQTSSGRVRELAVKHALGNTSMSAKSLRQMIGYNRLPSLLFKIDTIERGKDACRERVFSFTGRGWGHGVGLCQWGAKKMAEEGAGYEEILSTYYPLASLSKLK